MAVTDTGVSRLVPQPDFLCPQHILWLTLLPRHTEAITARA